MSETLTTLTERLFLTPDKLKILARILTRIPKDRISSNQTPGADLSSSTIRTKRYYGSSSPSTKLRDTGELLKDITNEVKDNLIKVGSTDKLHPLRKRKTSRRWKRRTARNERIKNSDLAQIHNEGLGQEKRSFLFPGENEIYEEEKRAIINFLDDLVKGKI